jgi:transcriptional regulator with XRE-family HTH domain
MSNEPDLASSAVADNLRRLRKQHKLSLDELALRSGVSKTMLHQIESRKSTPTISLLWKVATGLGVPFSNLIQQEERAGLTVLRRENAKLLFNADQTFSSRALFPFDGSRRQAEFYELRIKPGGHEQAEAHAAGTMENLILVSGETTTITLGTQTATLKPGDAIVFEAAVPHSYRNDSQTKEAVLYLVMTYAQS